MKLFCIHPIVTIAIGIGLLFGSASGCSPSSTPSGSSAPSASSERSEPSTPAGVGGNNLRQGGHASESRGEVETGRNGGQAVSLQIANWEEIQASIAKHRGKVVVVDIWTTTCLTCVEEFPRFVALQKSHDTKRLACISVNCDYDGITSKPPGYYQDRVTQFLLRHKAGFTNYLLNVAFLDFLDQIDLASTPAVIVYDREGQLVKRFDNDDAANGEEFSMGDVQELVDGLLTGSPGEKTRAQ